jgi:hypothetical protein
MMTKRAQSAEFAQGIGRIQALAIDSPDQRIEHAPHARVQRAGIGTS